MHPRGWEVGQIRTLAAVGLRCAELRAGPGEEQAVLVGSALCCALGAAGSRSALRSVLSSRGLLPEADIQPCNRERMMSALFSSLQLLTSVNLARNFFGKKSSLC